MDVENKYGTLEMQQYYIPILNHIDELCRKYDIKYSISDGSLIGAIRHKGFVPWDDDIDISFDRSNYNKFLSVVERELDPDYILIRDMWVRRISRKDNPLINSIPPEGCIDLFVFDNVPDSKVKNKIKNLTIKMLQGMLKRKVFYEGFSIGHKCILFVTHYVGKLFPWKVKQIWFDRVSQWGNAHQTKQKARYCCSYRYISNIRYPADITDEYTDVEFEGKKYMSVKEWDSFLSIDYGDYMELPPEEKRIPKHKHT